MKVSIITPAYPTEREPYRGQPIWTTLKHLSHYVDLNAYCMLPKYPLPYQSRSYIYSPPSISRTDVAFDFRTITYWAIPWVTRTLNGMSIYRNLRAWVARERPDLLLTYWIYPDGYASILLGREFGIPVIVSSRGSDLKLLPANGGIRRKIEFTLAHASSVLCVSSDLGKVAENLGATREKIHIIRNGVDGAVFHYRHPSEARRELGLAADRRIVLFVGRLVSLKGLENLVEAIAIAARRCPNTMLALAGAGYLEPELRRRAQRLGVSDQVLFLGPLPSSRIAAWMNASDALCLPSDSEGCPNVVLEALSCGQPVVGAAVGGVPELVNRSCGVLVASNDAPTIAGALEESFGTQWDRPAIAGVGHRGWEQVARETYQVCEQVTIAYGHRN